MSQREHRHGPQLLHCSRFGFLVYCPGCDRFQLGFGTFRIVQDWSQLNAFAGLVSLSRARVGGRAERDLRDIHIDTPYPGFGLIFSLSDLEALEDMLSRCLLIVESQHRIRLQ